MLVCTLPSPPSSPRHRTFEKAGVTMHDFIWIIAMYIASFLQLLVFNIAALSSNPQWKLRGMASKRSLTQVIVSVRRLLHNQTQIPPIVLKAINPRHQVSCVNVAQRGARGSVRLRNSSTMKTRSIYAAAHGLAQRSLSTIKRFTFH
ncbi:hypothetical protein NXS19_005345 [Fusarium pseudograminearum]|nr:hypothetical protein NXS19_005345 [Fusarium pseudograminearum]